MADQNLKINITAQDLASKALEQLRGNMSGLQAAASGVGGAFVGITALLAGGAMFKDVISTTQAVTGEVVKLSKSFGITTQEASVLRVALDDAFLTVDDMSGGLGRITKALVGNEAAFKTLGVTTRDSNGNYRNSVDIMLDVNSALGKIEEGTNRNVAGMTIYGKGWAEASNLLKLNAEGMREAKARAEELHLIVGPEGVAQTKAYKLAMKDLDDVAESLKVQMGQHLLPSLTAVAVAFGNIGTQAVDGLGKNMGAIEANFRQLAMLAEKAGGSMTRLGWLLSGGNLTGAGKWFKEQNQLLEGRYIANDVRGQEILDPMGSIDPQMARAQYDKKNKKTGGDKFKPDDNKPSAAKEINGTVSQDPGFMNWRMDQAGQAEESAYIQAQEKELSASLAQEWESRYSQKQFYHELELESMRILSAAKVADNDFEIAEEQRKFEAVQQYVNMKNGLQQDSVQLGIGLLQIMGSKHRAAALAAIGIQKGLAIGETFVSTQAASMRALAELGPIAGPPVAAGIESIGYVKMGLIAATGIAQAAMGGGGGSGGAAAGSYANPIVTQPAAANNGILPQNITINIEGNVVAEDRWVEERLAPIIKDLANRRNVDFGLQPT